MKEFFENLSYGADRSWYRFSRRVNGKIGKKIGDNSVKILYKHIFL